MKCQLVNFRADVLCSRATRCSLRAQMCFVLEEHVVLRAQMLFVIVQRVIFARSDVARFLL